MADNPERGNWATRFNQRATGPNVSGVTGAPTADDGLGSIAMRFDTGDVYVKGAAGAAGWGIIGAQSGLPKTAWTMDPTNAYNSVAPGTNAGLMHRIMWPFTGTINALAIFCVATGSGNCDIGVYDTAATTRTKLASTGSTALSANAYVPGTVSLAVTAGSSADLAVSFDNATASLSSGAMKHNNMGQLPSGWIAVSGGAAPKFNTFVSTIFPLPATIAESGMGADLNVPLILARYA